MLTVTPEFQTAMEGYNRQILWSVTITRAVNQEAVPITAPIVSVTIQSDYDNSNSTATVVIDNTQWQYSPLNRNLPINQVSGTYWPLLYPENLISIYAGFQTAQGPEMVQLFQGVLGDQIQVGAIPGQITLQCRDYSKLLQDYYIFLSPYYERMLAEDIIADLVHNYFPNIQFHVQQPSNYLIVQYNQAQNTTLWDAIQSIASVMGWRLWFDETGVLQFAPVPVNNVTPMMTIDESLIVSDNFQLSDANIRNDIWVKAESPYTGDIIVANVRNQQSINLFGDRYYEADNDVTAYISTYEQAYQLAQTICAHLSYLQAQDDIKMPFWPTLEAGDFVALQNSKTGVGASDYVFLVNTVTHTLSSSTKTTEITVSSYQAVAPPSGTPPAAPTNLSGTIIDITYYQALNVPSGTIAGIGSGTVTTYYPQLTWTPPTTDISGNALTDLYGYTVYRSTSSSGTFYADASFRAYDPNGNLVTSWVDYTASGITVWYYLVAYDAAGNIGPPSPTLQITVPAPMGG